MVERTDGEQFVPQCCCGLENWREWVTSFETHESPWLGHSPDPGLFWSPESVLLIPDMDHPTDTFCQLTAGELWDGLRNVHRDLNQFLVSFGKWAQTQPDFSTEAVVAKLDTEFDICRPLQ